MGAQWQVLPALDVAPKCVTAPVALYCIVPVPALWQLLPERRPGDPWHAPGPGFPGSSSWYRGKIGTDGQTLLVSAKLKLVQARTSLGGINASLCIDSPVVREKKMLTI